MQFQRKNGSRVDIELLRPVEWIERHRLEAESAIFMSNAEIEVRGTGRVLAIEDCPPLADGEGAVVISRIKTHHAGQLVELHFENGETLTGTASHPIWSADRQDWVPLGELHEGEHTQSRDGLLRITRRIALPDMQPVYNLEIHGEHVYEVTHAGVLVHNNVADCLRLDAFRKKIAEGVALNADELVDYGKLVQDFDFNKHLKGMIGDAPKGMLDPHAHHILFKKGLGPAQQALAKEGQDILRRVGIDPIFGKEVLSWAPNRVTGQHGFDALENVLKKLRQVEADGGSYDDFVKALRKLGEIAADR